MGSNFLTLSKKQEDLIRKTVDMSVFVAPITADAITTLTDADKLLKALPAGYEDVGLINSDGAQFSREIEKSDITSAGRVTPTRSDITSDTTQLEIGCQETKLVTIGLHTGADVAGIVPDPTTGEVQIAKPERPKPKKYRCLAIGVDENEAGEIYVARFLPRAEVEEVGDQAYQSEEDEALLWPVTLTGRYDRTAGYSELWLFGGPGWFSMLTAMGF
ncbi:MULTISPECIES: hypothetical protein [Actinomadura]|uniref:Phage tail protein n=1 Tax=Actinomadura yumaensis TaxID=111807 RepID=A0ABW2CYC1_9ACTN|nr:hypothetical protein [Actinomadura sp. J1-007]MWK39572.1 hypothetical protein [Actinomadura sp. J1-007]